MANTLPRVSLVIAATLLFLGSALGGERKPILYIYTWSDYFEPEAIALFESENNCHVAIDYFDSNEAMYAKLKAGASGYDILTPSTYMTDVMRRQGMLRKLDHDKLPNMANLHIDTNILTEDPGYEYSIPYTLTIIGVGYNRARIGTPEPTWDIFARTDLAKRMTVLNDMREAIGAALKFLGYSLNTTDDAELAAAGAQLKKWKANLAKFEVDEAKIGLGSGEFLAIHGYNGDVALIMQENEDIDFFVPREGASATYDDFVILADSPNPDLAHAFINHFLDPETAALNMEGIRYYMPNAPAMELLPDDLRNSAAFIIDPAVAAKCEVIRDLGENNAKYIKLWDSIKAEE